MPKQVALALAWTLCIFLICWVPTRYVQPDLEPGGFSLGELQIDKVVHLGFFAILGYCLARVNWLRQRPRWILLIGATVAALSEVGQGVLPTGRSADLIDFLADFAGVFLGLWIYRSWQRPAERPSGKLGHQGPAGDFQEDEVELSVRG